MTQDNVGTGPRDRKDTGTRRESNASTTGVPEKKGGVTGDVPRRKELGRSGSVSSVTGKMVEDPGEETVALSQSFNAVTLTLGTFFKQVSLSVCLSVCLS